MFCCDDARKDISSEEENETPEIEEDKILKKNTLKSLNKNNSLNSFIIIENYLRDKFSHLLTPSQSFNLLSLIITKSKNNFIDLIDLSKILINFNLSTFYNEIILPFYILEKRETEINNVFSEESYSHFFLYNMRIIIEKELNQFYFNKNEKYANSDPSFNIQEDKNIKKINIIHLIIFFLFFSNINNKIKSKILFNLLNYNGENLLQKGRIKIYLIFRKMILISLFFPNLNLNYLKENNNVKLNDL